ncbi:MAG: tetratricopeptide repeat protein [Methanomicrobiales archaeon]|nr:tetratricopeptide repeat protein [Methanomicrobiales archaeon]NYT21103.1 tetratricopeptide repeat protein [Methanomicrobiales archaeon]
MTAGEESLFWKNRGDRYIMKEQFDHAISSYEYALHLDSDNFAAWNNLCCALYKAGRKDEAYRTKKTLADLKQKKMQELKASHASVFTSDILLFFVFLAVVWSILLGYWLYYWGGSDLGMGFAWAGIMAFIIVGWIWAFLLLWDTENTVCKFFALLITGFIGGGIIVLSRSVYRKIMPAG